MEGKMPFRDADAGQQLGPNSPVNRANHMDSFQSTGPTFHGDVLPASTPAPSSGVTEARKMHKEELEENSTVPCQPGRTTCLVASPGVLLSLAVLCPAAGWPSSSPSPAGPCHVSKLEHYSPVLGNWIKGQRIPTVIYL